MKQTYKVCIILVLLIVSYCMGCVDDSSASTNKNERFVVESYKDIYYNDGNDFGRMWVVHDEKNNVTLYITKNGYSGGIAAIPDSMINNT